MYQLLTLLHQNEKKMNQMQSNRYEAWYSFLKNAWRNISELLTLLCSDYEFAKRISRNVGIRQCKHIAISVSDFQRWNCWYFVSLIVTSFAGTFSTICLQQLMTKQVYRWIPRAPNSGNLGVNGTASFSIVFWNVLILRNKRVKHMQLQSRFGVLY